MKPAVEARAVAPGDVEWVARRMRAADVAECRAGGLDPLEALRRSVLDSDWARSAWVDGDLVAVFGVAPIGTVLDPVGAPWLLGTDDLTRHRRLLVRHARTYIRAMLAQYPRLWNAVHADNRAAVRFLRGMGFTLHTPVALPSGALFHPFEMKA